MKVIWSVCSAITAIAFAIESGAHAISARECSEGSEFIRNAALSRDNGIVGADFIARAQADFEVVKSFPIELRWFVQDEEDERFLLEAIRDVFDRPQPAAVHERVFLESCMRRSSV